MLKILKTALFLLLLSLAQSVSAGQPTDEVLKCPIGGKPVKTVSTFACSTFGQAEMSMRQVSSCDFVTRLPVCDKEAFPLYKEFSAAEIVQLKQIVKTDWYQKAKPHSRYLRAYLVEKELKTYTEGEMFWLLQGGHFYDPTLTYTNATYFAAFREAANTYLKVADNTEKKVVYLTGAFARVHSSEPKKALALLKAAARYKTPEDPFLDQYLKLVRQCVDKPASEKCAPDYVIDIE